ncbi:exonuclease 1 isoform X1 [Aegilops tauschii subsp. strangulata]|nr:exonuclease 1 isoform X1 [Aegilops tauschii subsp. strangulata]XP_044438752.1 exonuclease 1-like isoform X1 [Triticum aestivum]
MGIPNLLRFMKPFIEPVHIKKYAGQRVGIDAYSWLHKGAYSCSMELCMSPRSAGARRYISYFMHHVNLLRHHKVVPVVVFDGGSMPCKSATDEDRHKKRELSLVLGKEKLKQGNTAAAIDLFRKAVQITPSMAYQLIQILKTENVEFVVAPYEADAQLAYLATLDADQGGIAAVITEDSDLIAYGCTAIIFKMDRFGNGEEFIMEKTLETVKDGLCFQDFDQNLFTGMCILAGCDFLPSVPGIGTKRAYSLISKHKNIDLVLSTLKLDKRYSVPDDYIDSFWKTLAVFNHARVYDVKSKSLKHLKPLEERYLNYLAGDLDILGPALAPSMAKAIAEGRLNPVTMETFDEFSRTISLIEFIDTSALNVANQHGSQEILTQESSITICSSEESRDDITACAVDEISSGEQRGNKGVLALGKFLPQKHSSPAVECKEVKPKNTPDNNPFKKRKLPTDQGQVPDQNELLIDLDEEEAVVLCSSLSRESVGPAESLDRNGVSAGLCWPLTQESVASIPNERSSKRQSQQEAFRNKTNKNKDERSGLLKFFMRL